jgi:hypothetical protein
MYDYTMTTSPPEKGSTGSNERTKASSTVAAAVGTGRSKMVFHRKKVPTRSKFASTKRLAAPIRVGLSNEKAAVFPSSKKRGLPTAKPVPDLNVPEDVNAPEKNDDEFDEIMPSTWRHSAGAPSDTLLAIQSLGRRPETSLSIPMSGGNVITSILSSQLYPILQNDDDVTGDAAVSQEIQDLIRQGTICKLTVPPPAGSMSSSNALSLSILLLTSDYLIAVQDAVERHHGIPIVASWFVAHLKDWTSGSRISLRDLETSYNGNCNDNGDKSASTQSLNNNNNTGSSDTVSREYTLQQVLQELQRMQVLLPCHSTDTYQLWLPEWGTVLAAWDRATTKLIQTLKRSTSMRQERSEQSLLQQDPYSPIPRSLLVHWLTIQGRVQVVQRPYGKFVQLVKTKTI